MGLRTPQKSVLFIRQISRQSPHDAAVAGDQYIFIAFLLKFPQELRTAGFHAGGSLDCFRCREYFGQGPVESHSRSEKKVFLLLVFAKIDLNDPDHYLASENVFDVAKKLKLWDGKGEFSFWRAYSGVNYLNEEKNYSVRELYIMNQLAPSLHLCDTITDLPISVRPDQKVSVEQVSKLLASYYEGTDKNLSGRHLIPNPKVDGPDSIVSPFSNPWMRPDEINMYHAMGDSVMKNIRTVSVPWCSYSTVIQLRSWLPDEVGGVAWIAFDNPGESPRIPIFAGVTALPAMLEVCGQQTDRDDAALWHFRKANRLATVRWGTYREMIEPARDYFMQKGMRELPFVERTWQALHTDDPQQAEIMLNGYTADFFGATVNRWDEIARKLWRQTWTGF